MVIMGPKMRLDLKSGSALRVILYNFAQSKNPRGASKLYYWFFQKQSHSVQF